MISNLEEKNVFETKRKGAKVFQTIKIHSTNHNAVSQAQSMLLGLGYSLVVDGKFGRSMEAAVIAFQWENQLVMDGIIGEKTWKVMMLIASHYLHETSGQFLSESDLVKAADKLDIELAAIKAVNEVESRGSGFLNNFPKILFERHVFWKRLKKHGLDPEQYSQDNANILQKSYGGYKGGVREIARLEKAKVIHESAALESASWGLFQIMGYHWKTLDYSSVEDFMRCMMMSEAEQLEAFVRFIQHNRLDKWLRLKAGQTSLELENFEKFAYRYNGPAYLRNSYHTKMFSAYKKYGAGITEQPIILSDAA